MFQLIQNTFDDIIVVKDDEEIILGREAKMFSTTAYYYYVSRKHCAIKEHLGALSIEDLGSSNGTFINGKKIADETCLHKGDIVSLGGMPNQFGSITFIVR